MQLNHLRIIFLTHSLRVYLTKTEYLFNPFDFKLQTFLQSFQIRYYAI